mmetsp:Transcript_103517/g.322500  ORF Transcript_103517/g.322500 Transcript_103517/m.322500 type:complete len:316 (-) Transcript_103517:364-1311(-)
MLGMLAVKLCGVDHGRPRALGQWGFELEGLPEALRPALSVLLADRVHAAEHVRAVLGHHLAPVHHGLGPLAEVHLHLALYGAGVDLRVARALEDRARLGQGQAAAGPALPAAVLVHAHHGVIGHHSNVERVAHEAALLDALRLVHHLRPPRHDVPRLHGRHDGVVRVPRVLGAQLGDLGHVDGLVEAVDGRLLAPDHLATVLGEALVELYAAPGDVGVYLHQGDPQARPHGVRVEAVPHSRHAAVVHVLREREEERLDPAGGHREDAVLVDSHRRVPVVADELTDQCADIAVEQEIADEVGLPPPLLYLADLGYH